MFCKIEIKCFLSEKNDHLDTYLEIHAGAGGTESQDWANMLRRMYLKWVEKNKKHYKDLQKKWAENNKDIINQKRKEYVQKNPDKQKKWCRTRYLKDPQKYKADSRVYCRLRKKQTVALSKNLKNQIKIIYRKRIFMGTKYHVDHIIPLRGKNVSGLHVPWNLQIITAKENLSKNNKF